MPQAQVVQLSTYTLEESPRQQTAVFINQTDIENCPRYNSSNAKDLTRRQLAHDILQDLNTIERIANAFAVH
ncbi:hypothetical protein E4T56_gene12561 [Termitomyces sp. T112]|nr:hypothetical protein E4T56_gene12561 [Termitomyces sp. T112]